MKVFASANYTIQLVGNGISINATVTHVDMPTMQQPALPVPTEVRFGLVTDFKNHLTGAVVAELMAAIAGGEWHKVAQYVETIKRLENTPNAREVAR